MEYGVLIGILHQAVGYLLYPVILALMVSAALCFIEVGIAVVEAVFSLRRLAQNTEARVLQHFDQYAAIRLERVDLLSRAGPILGLMGTLIPLGPGLTALGNGQLDMLATALSVAFDTTVLGLLVGLLAFVIAKMRRRWYEAAWRQLSDNIEKCNTENSNIEKSNGR